MLLMNFIPSRMECPPGCPEIIYQIMRSCWKWDAVERPHFWEIHGTLVSLLQPPPYCDEDFLDPPQIPLMQSQPEVSPVGMLNLALKFIICLKFI